MRSSYCRALLEEAPASPGPMRAPRAAPGSLRQTNSSPVSGFVRVPMSFFVEYNPGLRGTDSSPLRSTLRCSARVPNRIFGRDQLACTGAFPSCFLVPPPVFRIPMFSSAVSCFVVWYHFAPSFFDVTSKRIVLGAQFRPWFGSAFPPSVFSIFNGCLIRPGLPPFLGLEFYSVP